MFDFTDDYFREFPVVTRPSTSDFIAALPSFRETSPLEEGLQKLDFTRLSAARTAPFALAMLGFGNSLGPISHLPAGPPQISRSDPCKLWCFPGAEAELVPQKRVNWALHRRLPLASMPNPGAARINVLTARNLASAPGAPTFLSDAATWNDDVVGRLAVEQLKAFMQALPRDQWEAYLKLRTDIRTAAATISRDFQARVKSWEDGCVAAINSAINTAIESQPGGPMDCRTAWLHTYYYEYEMSSRSPRALAEGQLVPRRRSVRLWDAARQGFSYAMAWKFGAGRDFAKASFISRDKARRLQVKALDVSMFADIVRTVDPGARAGQLVEQLLEPSSLTGRLLHNLHANTLLFDIMDAARSPATTGVDAAVMGRLTRATSQVQGNNDWRRYRAEFGITVPALGVGQWVQLPFFTYDVDGVGVVAHAMGHPDYPLRVFSDLAKAEAWLNATVDLAAPWLQAQLSGDDRERAVALREALAQAGAPLPGLNPVATLLRDTVNALLPTPEVTLAVDSRVPRRLPNVGGSQPVSPWTLASPAGEFAQSRIRANVARLATSRGQLDWNYAVQAGLAMASEILELLIMPVPGGLAGLNRIRTVAFGGFIGLGLAQGTIDASHGDGARITETLADILDLALGLFSGRAAVMAELRQAGYRRVPLGTGTSADGLWRFDANAMVRPMESMLDGQQPSNDGVIHVLGQSFVRLELSSGRTAVLAASRNGDGPWRLRPRDAADYAPAIKRSGDQWTLDLDDSSRLDATGLLSRLLSMAGAHPTEDTVTRLQEITGVTHAELIRIWNGEVPPSWFNGAATRVAIGDIVDRVRSTSLKHDEPVHAIGEAIYVQFLADTLGKRMHVVDDNGVTAYRLDPRAGPVPNGGEFPLHRQPGGFYGATVNAPRGERVGIPGILDVVLAGQASLGSSHAPPAGVAALDARRQLVNEASDAWVRRHARAIQRACLRAFNLEMRRRSDDFNPVGQIAVGRREVALDIRTEAIVAKLQYSYPGLKRADAMAILADQTFGPLARGERDADGFADALNALRTQSRVVAARWGALTGQYDADSEALLLTGLTSHPAWPADRSIEVIQGGLDPDTGDVISHGLSVARFGRGDKSLILVRTPTGSHRGATMQGATMVISQHTGAHEASLLHRVTQMLPEADRRLLLTVTPASIVASMGMPATSKALVDASAYGVRAGTPLGVNYAAPITPASVGAGPFDGYYTLFDTTDHYVQVDGIMVRAIPDARDPRRAHLLPYASRTNTNLDNAPVARLDRHKHWRLERVVGSVRDDLDDWKSPDGNFPPPIVIEIPVDGIESIAVTGSTWRQLVVGGEHIRVTFDHDLQAWLSFADPRRTFRRVQGQWHEGAVTGILDTPTAYATLEVPSIPVLPVDARPLLQTIGYGWTGRESPSATWLARLSENAITVRDGNSGWSSQLHVDLDDVSQVQTLTTTLAPLHVEVRDLRRDLAFLDWLKTPAGQLYTAARDGTHPCYAAAVDVLRFGWILKRHGGLYVDMDDVILKDWSKVGELETGPFQLLSGGPVSQALLGLDWDINTSHLGSHAGNPLLDRVVDTMVERAARKPEFFNQPRQGNAEKYGRELSDLTGPGVLKDVLERHAPEIPGLIGAMRVLRSNDIRYGALETAIGAATDSYFPLADRIEPGHANSWVPSDD